jgi:hypothetical protein
MSTCPPRWRPSIGGAYPRPGNWPDPTEAAAADGNIAIQLAPLPTYASWSNPIEKLWRRLKREVLHMHDKTQRWSELWDHVGTFLER